MKAKFTVSVELPDGVTKSEMYEYIKDAVNGMKGSRHPDDPIFNMDYGDWKLSHKKIIPVKKFLPPCPVHGENRIKGYCSACANENFKDNQV